MPADVNDPPGFAPGEIITSEPASAHRTRVYDEFLAELAGTKPGDLAASAVSIVGPRNRVAKLVKGLRLLG